MILSNTVTFNPKVGILKLHFNKINKGPHLIVDKTKNQTARSCHCPADCYIQLSVIMLSYEGSHSITQKYKQ